MEQEIFVHADRPGPDHRATSFPGDKCYGDTPNLHRRRDYKERCTGEGPFALDTSNIVHCGRPIDSVGGTFCDLGGPVVDYIYDANAGVGGNSPSIFNYLHSSGTGMPVGPAYLVPDYTDNILSGLNSSPDNFAGNDHSLCNYSDTAPFHVEYLGITQAGDYRLHVTGRSKATQVWLTRPTT